MSGTSRRKELYVICVAISEERVFKGPIEARRVFRKPCWLNRRNHPRDPRALASIELLIRARDLSETLELSLIIVGDS
jgi:hypothetical protein